MVQNLYSLPTTTTTNVTVVSSMHQVLSALFTFCLNRENSNNLCIYGTHNAIILHHFFRLVRTRITWVLDEIHCCLKPSYCRFVNNINEIDVALVKVLYKMEKQKICLTGCYYVVWSYCLEHTRQFLVLFGK